MTLTTTCEPFADSEKRKRARTVARPFLRSVLRVVAVGLNRSLIVPACTRLFVTVRSPLPERTSVPAAGTRTVIWAVPLLVFRVSLPNEILADP